MLRPPIFLHSRLPKSTPIKDDESMLSVEGQRRIGPQFQTSCSQHLRFVAPSCTTLIVLKNYLCCCSLTFSQAHKHTHTPCPPLSRLHALSLSYIVCLYFDFSNCCLFISLHSLLSSDLYIILRLVLACRSSSLARVTRLWVGCWGAAAVLAHVEEGDHNSDVVDHALLTCPPFHRFFH